MMFDSKIRVHGPKGLFKVLALLAALPTSVLANVLQDISFSSLPGDRVELVLTTESPVDTPLAFTTDNPARIAIDLPDTTSGLATKTKAIGVGVARSVTAIEAKNRTRVVVNLLDAVPYSISSEGNRLIVAISGGAGAGSATQADQQTATVSVTGEVTAGSQKLIEAVDFRRGEDGEGRIEVKLSDPSMAVDMRQQGDQVVLEFVNADLPPSLARTLDVTDFATPVTQLKTHPEGRNVRMVISATGDYEHLAYQANDLYTVEFRALSKKEKEALQKERLVYSGERLSLNFQDIEVRAVLQLLADFTGLNMVVSDTVSGNITLRLRNVPWDQAMDIILKTKGLSMRRTDNVILVAPTEEIAAREKLELESQQQIEELAPLRSELVQINYAKASDLAELLKQKENKLLSDRGSVTIDERTNTLLLQDTAAKLDEIRSLLADLDIPVRQVLIESRIVIANNDFAKDLGVKLGISGAVDSDNNGNTLIVGGGLAGDLDASPLAGPFIFTGESENENLLVNLPRTLAAGQGGVVNFVLGRMGSHLLRLELSAMQQEGKGEVISSPHVITSDQNTATIKQGFELAYNEATSSGATNIAFKEALLGLEVTPHITPDDRVIMDLLITKDSPRVIPGIDLPAIDKREVETSVLVDNGETVVLGGVFERNRASSRASVPFFGDLPAVGVLFRQEQVEDQNNELLIFVTPKILKETLAVRR